MREIRRVVVHHSASDFGDADLIDSWHRERGWRGIGYHYVILNGRRNGSLKYRKDDDGLLEIGRPHAQVGAHAGRVGANGDSIGICLIGNGRFARWQFCRLIWLLQELNREYSIGDEGIVGHGEIDPLKSQCPGFDMELLRAAVSLAGEVSHDTLGDH